MSERLGKAKNGAETAYSGDKALHSIYDPLKEAERFIASLKIKENVSFFLCVEPALGYALGFLKKKYPAVPVIAVRSGTFFAGKGVFDAEWHPGLAMSLQQFLEDTIPEQRAAAVEIIEWKPSLAAYGELYAGLVSRCVDFLKRAMANARTAEHFGKRWLRNVIKNTGGVEKTFVFSPGSVPVIITGAGPGLEDCLGIIKKAAGAAFILAAASSVPALLARGIIPSLILSTDGGGWAERHLIEIERLSRNLKKKPVLAVSLNAALPSRFFETPILLISDNSLWQNTLLRTLGLPFLPLPQRGTVSAQALDLALCLSGGPLYLAGMDLAGRDIKSHARPYALDFYVEEASCRLTPAYSGYFERTRAVLEGGSFEIYAAWFRDKLKNNAGRIFFLGTCPGWARACTAKKEISVPAGTDQPCFSVRFPERPLAESGQKRSSRAAGILGGLIKNSPSGEIIAGEISGFLGLGKNSLTGSLTGSCL